MKPCFVIVRKDSYRSTQFNYYDKIPFLDPQGNCNFISDGNDNVLFLTFGSTAEASLYAYDNGLDAIICSYIVGQHYAVVENFVTSKK